MILIYDLKTGNISSIKKALDYLNIKSEVSDDVKDLAKCSKIILSGVGSFDNFVKKLEANEGIEKIKYQLIDKKKPFLGICLGMQILLKNSEEGKRHGLGLIDGTLKKFNTKNNLRVPHMGLNYVDVIKESKLITSRKKFYFVHSYYAEVSRDLIFGITDYGSFFPSYIKQDNLYGVQFHPEKSQKDGLELLKNFSNL